MDPQTQTRQRAIEQASLCCDPGPGRLGPCPQTSTVCVQPGSLRGQALPEALGCGPCPGARWTQAMVTLRAAEWPGHLVQTPALPFACPIQPSVSCLWDSVPHRGLETCLPCRAPATDVKRLRLRLRGSAQ